MRPKTYITIYFEICYFVYIFILQKMGKNCTTKIPTK